MWTSWIAVECGLQHQGTFDLNNLCYSSHQEYIGHINGSINWNLHWYNVKQWSGLVSCLVSDCTNTYLLFVLPKGTTIKGGIQVEKSVWSMAFGYSSHKPD